MIDCTFFGRLAACWQKTCDCHKTNSLPRQRVPWRFINSYDLVRCRARRILSWGSKVSQRVTSENLTSLPSICLQPEEAPMPSKGVLLLAILALAYGFLPARVPDAFASSKVRLQPGNLFGEARTFKTLTNFNGTNGGFPQYGSLLQGFDGNFYGTTYEGGVGSDCPYRQG